MNDGSHEDEPLPATAAFLTFLGLFMAFGWMATYLLLRSRW